MCQRNEGGWGVPHTTFDQNAAVIVAAIVAVVATVVAVVGWRQTMTCATTTCATTRWVDDKDDMGVDGRQWRHWQQRTTTWALMAGSAVDYVD